MKRGEPRVPALVAVAVAIGGQVLLSSELVPPIRSPLATSAISRSLMARTGTR